MLLSWVLTNGLLAAGILAGGGSDTFSNAGSKQALYMTFVLVFVAATSVVVSDVFGHRYQLVQPLADALPDLVSAIHWVYHLPHRQALHRLANPYRPVQRIPSCSSSCPVFSSSAYTIGLLCPRLTLPAIV